MYKVTNQPIQGKGFQEVKFGSLHLAMIQFKQWVLEFPHELTDLFAPDGTHLASYDPRGILQDD